MTLLTASVVLDLRLVFGFLLLAALILLASGFWLTLRGIELYLL